VYDDVFARVFGTAGLGRDAPNENPTLPEPKRPETSYPPYRVCPTSPSRLRLCRSELSSCGSLFGLRRRKERQRQGAQVSPVALLGVRHSPCPRSFVAWKRWKDTRNMIAYASSPERSDRSGVYLLLPGFALADATSLFHTGVAQSRADTPFRWGGWATV